MSYSFSAGLQARVYERLRADGALAGVAIYDAPLGLAPGDTDYVTLGEETVRDWGTKTSDGAIHDFTVTVHSGREGFAWAKQTAGAVCAALVDAPLALGTGRLVALRFLRAGAERGRAPEKRKISLRFRAVIDRDG